MRRAAIHLALAFTAVATAPADAQIGLSTEINQAIDRGIYRLLRWQNADGSFAGAGHQGNYPMGQSALATYTLLKSGLRKDDPAIERAFRYLSSLDFQKVYSVSCWMLAMDATRDRAYSAEIHRGAAWLEGCFNDRDDLWGYPDGDPELSNTQFAVLALWVAEQQHGYEASPRLWADMIQGTLDMQNDDGGFGYKLSDRPYSHGSMTTAGITTLEIAIEALREDGKFSKAVKVGEDGLERAWEWMDRHFTLTGNPTSDTGLLLDRHKITTGRLYMFHYYYVWGVERIAAIAGRAEIGGRDWYREGAIQLLREEEEEGGWSHVDTTAFALLFLRRATYSGMAGQEQEASIPRSIAWRYTTEKPPEGWEKPGFDDSAWKVGAGSFGNFQAGFRNDRTEWPTSEIWMRREFRWLKDPAELRLIAMHDDGVGIYVNGVEAVSEPDYSGKPTEYEVPDAVRETIQVDKNLVAVYGKDNGGARTIDVAFTDRGGLAARLKTALVEEPRPWMQRKPDPGVPFIQRWNLAGPYQDKKHELFPETPIREDVLAPVVGQKSRGMPWRERVSPGPLLDFHEALKDAEKAHFYAFTYLHAEDTTDLVLWVGADDGLRVWLDEELVLSHHAHSPAKRDEIPIPIRLTPGVHGLMIRVENHTGGSGLYARLCDLDGATPVGVRPALAREDPDWAEAARTQPGFFTLDELARILPLDGAEAIDFDRESDVAALAADGNADGFPRWDSGAVKRKKTRIGTVGLNPGRKGIAGVVAATADRPARLYWRKQLPELGPRFAAVYAPVAIPPDVDATTTPAPGGVRLVLQAFHEGTLTALGEVSAETTDTPDKRAWQRMDVDLGPVAGRDVLLILEVHRGKDGYGAGAVLLDELELLQE